MIAYYDLERYPPSFDAVGYAMWIESCRHGDDPVEIRILPGPVDGFRNDSTWPHEAAQRRHLLLNVLVPIFELLPNCTVKVLAERESPAEGSIGYTGLNIGARIIADMLREGIRPLRTPWKPKVDTVTITLRECEHWPERNSNIREWVMAAQSLRNVVVVRDTRFADEPLPVPTCPAASKSIQERAKLYCSAYCNFFVNNGPAWLCVALDAPMVMLRPATEGIKDGYMYGRNIYRDMGIKDQLPTSPPYQRLVWEDDTAENILAAFDEFKRLNG